MDYPQTPIRWVISMEVHCPWCIAVPGEPCYMQAREQGGRVRRPLDEGHLGRVRPVRDDDGTWCPFLYEDRDEGDLWPCAERLRAQCGCRDGVPTPGRRYRRHQ